MKESLTRIELLQILQQLPLTEKRIKSIITIQHAGRVRSDKEICQERQNT